MIELTEKQAREVGETAQPVRVIDPSTRQEFFLVRAELFSRLQTASGDLEPQNSYPAIDGAFAPGWDEPNMSDYDTYEQQKR